MWQIIVAVILVALIVLVVKFTSKTLPTSCTGRGQYPCPETDSWSNTDPNAPPIRICNGSFQWDTPGGIGPSKCLVTCPAGYFPCWDKVAGKGACKFGSDASACTASCTAEAGQQNSCQNGGSCDLTTGQCNCVGGFAGNLCQLPPAETCYGGGGYCISGYCNRKTGACVCLPGAYGKRCNPAENKCDLNLCQQGNKYAICSDPNGPNPGNCICPSGVGPSNGEHPCTICPAGKGPARDCTMYQRSTGVFLTAQCYGKAWAQPQKDEKCQGEFGPSSTENTYLAHDDACGGTTDRFYCNYPGTWYTSDPNAQSGYNTQFIPGGVQNPAGLTLA